MGAPQIIMIVLMALDLLLAAALHGEPKEGKYNFHLEFMSKIIVALILLLGGFWG